MTSEKQLIDLANAMRRDVLEMTTAAGSGHPSSCLSCAEIMSSLFFHEMRYDIKNSENPDNDEFILSKGHAAPILYSALHKAGCIKTDLMKLRKLKSPLEGHPIPKSLNWVKVASGSLGQGLSVGVGMALAGKLQGRKFRVYILMGDSESAEGSVWEALQLAPYYNLDNLCLVIDANRLGQRGQTMVGHELEKYSEGIKSFGWKTIIVDGHDVKQITEAFESARRNGLPTAIIARTWKGKGVSFIENREGWHGRALNKEELKEALEEIPKIKIQNIKIEKPHKIEIYENKKSKLKSCPYEPGAEVATRLAYGIALANLAKSNPKIIAVDAEVSNSTKSEEVRKTRPGQFVEAFIAEQDMVGICLGLSKKGFDVFGSTFSAFLSRAHDQIRMSAISNGNFVLCGSHSGVSIGEDGASQMGLEDIAMFRALPSSIVFYPSDGISTEKLVYLAHKLKGIKYIRTTRDKTPVIYNEKENFPLGEFKVLRESKKDRIVLVGSGITLHEALAASELLLKKKVASAVVDLYCIKPLNAKRFISFVKKHGKRIVVAEDHYEEGGIGEMLAEELENSGIEIKHLFVGEVPHSGSARELLEKYKIDRKAIVKCALKLVKKN
jgi:transketolase